MEDIFILKYILIDIYSLFMKIVSCSLESYAGCIYVYI